MIQPSRRRETVVNEPPAPTPEPLAESRVDALLDAALAADWREALASDPSPTATLRARITASHDAAREPRVVPAAGPEGAPGEYAIVRRLGEGGMGVVFEAKQKSIGRAVALKMMRPTLQDDPAARAMFFAETTIMGVLEHPGIVTIYDAGVTDRGRPFYAMRLVRGGPWSRILARRSQADNLDTLEKVAEIVAHAHERGVIHRDLKPANIFLDDRGDVWVGDWGLATRLAEGRTRGVSPGAGLGGTPAYLPPEMASGDDARVGVASDVYVLGAILHEILYGRPPHNAATAEDALRRAAIPFAPPAPPDRSAPTRAAWELMRQALAAAPEDRPPTALHFAGKLALLRARHHVPPRKRRIFNRKNLPYVLAALLVLAMASLFFPAWTDGLILYVCEKLLGSLKFLAELFFAVLGMNNPLRNLSLP